MITANMIFLTVFAVLGLALASAIQSYRFTTYRMAVARGRQAKPVWRPFWLSPRER